MKYLFIACLLSGCSVQHTSSSTSSLSKVDETKSEVSIETLGLKRYEDKEFGVVCYRVFGQEGVSCLIKSQLREGK